VTIDISNAFKAEPCSVLEFLQRPGQGCYIPAYQREYRWDKANVDRLFEDALSGIGALCERNDTISFLGTVIAVHDTKYATVKPHFRNEMPDRVMTIIDGQQRISTFILAFVAIHNLLSAVLPRLEKDEAESAQWLFSEVEKMLASLRQCIVYDKISGKGLHRYYPRLIRSFDDVWSTRPESARYTSPIAKLIWSYLEHMEDSDATSKSFAPTVPSGKREASHRSVKEVYDSIKRRLGALVRPSEEMPSVLDLAVSKGFGEALLGYEVPNAVCNRILSDADDIGARKYREAFAAVMFAYYLQRRMAFTLVISTGEDDAFDMFEALNTTGQPLTAFETFRPRVIEAEGLEEYQSTPSHDHLQRVERYLDRYGADTRKLERSTSDLLVSFALAETGYKLGKKLNEQRQYLRSNYGDVNESTDKDAMRAFTGRLADMASFLDTAWDPADGSPSFGQTVSACDQTRVAFEFLRSLDHTITIAPLSRFFSAATQASAADRAAAAQSFGEAVRLCAAFSAIWRAWHDGKTERIDSIYRDAMATGDGSRALAARPRSGKDGVVDIEILRTVLKAAMADAGIVDRAAWTSRLTSSGVGKNSKLAKFLLVAAHHDAVPMTDGSARIQPGRSGTNQTLTPAAWAQFAPMEVEHIAPVSDGASAWPQDLYGDDELCQTFGNLVLLSKQQNIVMSNHAWKKKQAGYEALAAETDAEFEAVRATANAAGLTLPARSEVILATSQYSPLLVPVAKTTKDWNAALVRARSVCLAGLVWDRLHPWIE
jgi:hypothetical protein